MARIIILFVALVVTVSANDSLSAESLDSLIESAVKCNGSSNPLSAQMQCATDVTDEVAAEFGIQGLWNGTQVKLLENMNSLFACVKFEGFKGKR